MAHSSLMFQAFRSRLTVYFHRNFGLPLGRFPSIFISTTARMFSVSSLRLTCLNHFHYYTPSLNQLHLLAFLLQLSRCKFGTRCSSVQPETELLITFACLLHQPSVLITLSQTIIVCDINFMPLPSPQSFFRNNTYDESKSIHFQNDFQ